MQSCSKLQSVYVGLSIFIPHLNRLCEDKEVRKLIESKLKEIKNFLKIIQQRKNFYVIVEIYQHKEIAIWTLEKTLKRVSKIDDTFWINNISQNEKFS